MDLPARIVIYKLFSCSLPTCRLGVITPVNPKKVWSIAELNCTPLSSSFIHVISVSLL